MYICVNNFSTQMQKLKFTESDQLKFLELYDQGISMSRIAEIYNTDGTTISRYLKKLPNFRQRKMSEIKRKYPINENYFDEIDTPNKAYFMGWIYSDGYHNPKTNNIVISLQEKDKEILEKLYKELGTDRQLFYEIYDNPNHSNQYKLTITNKHISQVMLKYGVTPNKSLTVTFPEWLDKKLYRHFIRGIYDGDGSVYFSSNKVHFNITSTENLLIKIQQILVQNTGVNINKLHSRKNSVTCTRSLTYSGNICSKKILDWLYEDAELFLERKYLKYKQLFNI